MKRKLLLLTLLLALLLVSTAQAMSSEHYRLDWLVPLTSGGGGTAASGHFEVSYTIGQSVIGSSGSEHFDLDLGFWQEFQEFVDRIYLWLPMLHKGGAHEPSIP